MSELRAVEYGKAIKRNAAGYGRGTLFSLYRRSTVFGFIIVMAALVFTMIKTVCSL